MDESDGAGTEIIDAVPPGDDAPLVEEPAPETVSADAPLPAKAATPAEEQFIDPSTLPDEIKPHWKRMASTYNKKLGEIRAGKQDIEFLAKFRSDPEFARMVLREESRRLGVDMAPNGAEKPATAPTQHSGDAPPAQLVERIRQRLAPELQWMAEQNAAAAWEAIRFNDAPKEQQAQARQQAERQTQYDALASQLTAAAPGWEEHEPDMSELLGFLQSPAFTHPKFGSKLELLHRMIRPENGTARVAAIRTMGEAARNAARTGQPGRSTITNLPDRVRKATTTRDAMAIASEEAERELRARGVAVPD